MTINGMTIPFSKWVMNGYAVPVLSLAKTQRTQRFHVQMTNARPQSYAARATLLAKGRKGILQAKFWEARAMGPHDRNATHGSDVIHHVSPSAMRE